MFCYFLNIRWEECPIQRMLQFDDEDASLKLYLNHLR